MLAQNMITIVGWTNTGKSTLLNRWQGNDISIVSSRPQTTRWPLMTRLNSGEFDHHLSLIDTPGLSRRHDDLAKRMRQGVHNGLDNADYVLLLWDATYDPQSEAGVSYVSSVLETNDKPVIIAINKVDIIPKPRLLAQASRLDDAFNPRAIFMISARKGDGCDDLLKYLWSLEPRPENNKDGPARQLSESAFSVNLYERLAEITRRSTLQCLRQEIPYSMTVETTALQRNDHSWRVVQSVITSQDQHRAIIIGRNGRMLKRIGRSSRMSMMRQFDRTVHLSLEVKTDPNWLTRESKKFLG